MDVDLIDRIVERIAKINNFQGTYIIEYACNRKEDVVQAPIEWSKDYIIIDGRRYLYDAGSGISRGMLLDISIMYSIRRIKGNVVVNDAMEYSLLKLLHNEYRDVSKTIPRRIAVKYKNEDFASYIINMSTSRKPSNYFRRILRNIIIWNMDMIVAVESHDKEGFTGEFHLSTKCVYKRCDISQCKFTSETVDVSITNYIILVRSPDMIYRIICNKDKSVGLPKMVLKRLSSKRKIRTAFKYRRF